MSSSAAVAMGLYFFPRGGSAQVARSLCRALGPCGWSTELFAGSIGAAGSPSYAPGFFAGLDCHALDYTTARTAWEHGADPMVSPVPMHASYEDKPGVADRSFFALDDDAFDRQVDSWSRHFATTATVRPTMIHLHHLTPMHDAVRAVWPGVPVVTHLHGTELKMLDDLDVAPAVHGRDGGVDSTDDGDGERGAAGGPGAWRGAWTERMRGWAAGSQHLVAVSAHDAEIAARLTPAERRHISVIGNGVDTDTFRPRSFSAADRMACWREFLVDDPRGWLAGSAEGSIRYRPADLDAFEDGAGVPVPVVLFSGRFLHFKRLRLLIEAHHALRARGAARSVLVVAGGFPGEWEGEHPAQTVARLGATDVFFVGWRSHGELARILNCSDVFAAPSVDEPFGLVYLEAMAAGLPAIATNTGGPPSFINTDAAHPSGWLVRPDDPVALATALAEAVSSSAERLARGHQAEDHIRNHYSWPGAAHAFATLYDTLLA